MNPFGDFLFELSINKFRRFPNGNELQFNYVDGEPVGDAVLVSEAGREEFKFVNGQKEVRACSIV